ncbi:MAG: hypothetical protein LUE86_14205 [Clostridiales bacterium]|nr:hypothetical protein [Clostridiales bacterium]
MHKHSKFWLFITAGVLMALTCLYIIVIGKPWDRLFAPVSTTSQETTDRPATSSDAAIGSATVSMYDTEYGNTDVSTDVSDAALAYIRSVYSTGYRRIAADFEEYRSQIKDQLSPIAVFQYNGQDYSPDEFIELHGEAMIQNRMEMECSYLSEYEMPETETTTRVNGTLCVTVYSASGLSYAENLFGIKEMELAEEYEIPYSMYLIKDAENKNWLVQEARNGYYKDEAY